MSVYTEYDPATGRVTAVGGIQRRAEAPTARAGCAILLDVLADPEQHYVVDGVLVERPRPAFDTTAILADDADTATLSGLPDPCPVYVDDVRYDVTGGQLEITSPQAAIYRVEVRADAFPARPLSVEVSAA